jgi:hypothetical protein
MRKLVSTASLAGLMLVLSNAGAAAQGPQSTAYEDNTAQAASPRLSFSQQNVFERASFAARERQSRVESRKWQGYSPLRPVYRSATLADFESYGRGPWDRYYGFHPYRGHLLVW